MYILHVTIRINRRRIKKSLKMCGRKEGRAVAPPQHCTWNTVCLSHLEVWQQPWDKPGSAGWKPQKLDSKIRKMASHLNGCYMETAVTLFQKSSQKKWETWIWLTLDIIETPALPGSTSLHSQLAGCPGKRWFSV